MKVMLDHCLRTQACIAVDAEESGTFGNGDKAGTYWFAGHRRADPHNDPEHQRELDALFTLGRLIREAKVTPFTYDELDVEAWRDTRKPPWFNAFNRCQFQRCVPAIYRSNFRASLDFGATLRKGGRKDRKAGLDVQSSQISFFEWLFKLPQDQAESIASRRDVYGLTLFEADSLRDLPTFKSFCRIGGSSENYPDIFHVWTAQRNGLDAFVTIDKKLINIFNNIIRSVPKNIQVTIAIMKPTALISAMGVDKLDPVPMEYGKFYRFGMGI